MPKKRDTCHRNGGRWTEAQFNSFIKSALRGASLRWRPISDCLARARVGRGLYKCELCNNVVPATLPPKEGNKRRIKNIIVDHIHPVIDPSVGFVSWDSVIERMFVEEDKLQAICYSCHTIKTKEERDIGTERRNNERKQDV